MDRIEQLWNEIQEDPSVWKDNWGKPVNYSGKFLDTVGEIFEKHGFGITKVYLINQSGRDRIQAFGIRKVLEKFKKYPEIENKRAIGRYIIKTLGTLKRMEV